MAKSISAVPGSVVGAVSTVKMDGSCMAARVAQNARRTYRVVKGSGIDDHEARKIVLERRKIAVPGHHVERAVALHRVSSAA